MPKQTAVIRLLEAVSDAGDSDVINLDDLRPAMPEKFAYEYSKHTNDDISIKVSIDGTIWKEVVDGSGAETSGGGTFEGPWAKIKATKTSENAAATVTVRMAG